MGRKTLQAPPPGTRFGRGQVLNEVRLTSSGRTVRGLELICDCGTRYQAQLIYVLDGKTRSCGCLRREMVAAKNRTPEARARPHPGTPTHGMKNHPLYSTWRNIMTRCYDPENRQYPWYGARGIAVDERWHDVQLFIADIEAEIGPRPSGLTLDRRDNDGNYGPGKVRWATLSEQQRNSRNCLPAGRNGLGHGIGKHPLYQKWRRMRDVCENPDSAEYPMNGGRGITIYSSWRSSRDFITWVEENLGPPAEPGLCLGRPDPDGNYEPGNLRWMTRKEIGLAQQAMQPVVADSPSDPGSTARSL